MSDKSMHFKSSIIAVIIIIALILSIGSLVKSAFKPHAQWTNTTEERIAPVGSVYVEGDIDVTKVAAAPKPSANKAARSGADIYKAICSTCHAIGVLGAPKYGNKANWAPRMGKGIDGLLAVAMRGKGSMPPRGTCGDCSDDELKSAIQHMLDAVK